MAKARKLKVFVTPIGFHDAYVAAPSRVAALRAWGSARDLFARGMACEVTDPDLMGEALAHPGEVIRRRRGPAEPPGDRSPKRDSGPRPSRTALDKAEAAIRTAEARHRKADAAAKARITAAERKRAELQERHAREAGELAAARDRARQDYDRALDRWRGRATDASD